MVKDVERLDSYRELHLFLQRDVKVSGQRHIDIPRARTLNRPTPDCSVAGGAQEGGANLAAVGATLGATKQPALGHFEIVGLSESRSLRNLIGLSASAGAIQAGAHRE